MRVVTSERGTRTWRAAHRGHVTASDAAAIMARPGSKRSEQLITRLVLDFEGLPQHLEEQPDPWAEQHEADLRSALARYRHVERKAVATVGFVTDDRLSWLGCSPHGLIGARGCVHFRIRRSLRSWHSTEPLARAELARLHLTMMVCGRAWCDMADFWDGLGKAPDKLRVQRLDFDHAWLLAQVLPRLVSLWGSVRARLAARETLVSDPSRAEQSAQAPPSVVDPAPA